MTKQKASIPMLLVTDLVTERTFMLVPTRRGSRKLNCSVMSARGRDLDVRTPYRTVPLYIRRSAKASLTW